MSYDPPSTNGLLEAIEERLAELVSELEHGDDDSELTLHDQVVRIADALNHLVPIAERIVAALERISSHPITGAHD